ncbi:MULTISPECIES: argininosuccinate lyase [unclassified Marinovum]
MKAFVGVAVALFLVGCGVDGAPKRPEADSPVAIKVTGTAEVGVSGGSN